MEWSHSRPLLTPKIADAAFDARIDGRDVDGIAAAGAAGAVGGEPVGIDVRAGFHETERAADIFRLPFGHDPAAVVALAIAPAAVVEAETGVTGGAELLEHHDVVLGVFEAEKARALDDAGIGLALIGVGQIEHAGELDAFAVKINFFSSHITPSITAFTFKPFKPFQPFGDSDSERLERLERLNDLNDERYARTAGRTSWPR